MTVQLPGIFKFLIGTWEGPETMAASPWSPGGHALGRYVYRPALSDQVLLQHYAQQREDGSTFELHGVLSVDTELQEVVWYSFDTYLPLPEAPARGSWNANGLQLEKATRRGRTRHHLTLEAGSLRHDITTAMIGTAPGDFTPFLQGLYSRVK